MIFLILSSRYLWWNSWWEIAGRHASFAASSDIFSELNKESKSLPSCFFLQGRATNILYILPITEKKRGFNISLFNSTPIPVPFFGIQSHDFRKENIHSETHVRKRARLWTLCCRNKCNVGYCFLNFRTSKALVRFRDEFHGQQSTSEWVKHRPGLFFLGGRGGFGSGGIKEDERWKSGSICRKKYL